MGGSASLIQIPNEILNETDSASYAISTGVIIKKLYEHPHEVISTVKRKSLSKLNKKAKSKIIASQESIRSSLPLHIKNLLSKVDIDPIPVSKLQGQSASTKELVTHIFECLDTLKYLVKVNQENMPEDEMIVNETQSVIESNKEAIGKLLHEMITIYTLCGDTIKVLLNADPDAAKIEDNFGRLPLHIAIDKDQPWIASIENLINAYPQALNRRDSSGRLPLHTAVDRQSPNIDVVKLLISKSPQSANARRGVGRVPLHYAIFASKPSIEVLNCLLYACPESAQATDLYGRLPLHYAVDKVNPQYTVVETLLNAYPGGASVKDSHMRLPLIIALERDNIDFRIIKLLYNANPTAIIEKDHQNKLPLQKLTEHYTKNEPNLPVLDFIANKYPDAILTYSYQNFEKIFDNLIQYAIFHNFYEMIRIFLYIIPNYDPILLKDLNWKIRKYVFLIAKQNEFIRKHKTSNISLSGIILQSNQIDNIINNINSNKMNNTKNIKDSKIIINNSNDKLQIQPLHEIRKNSKQHILFTRTKSESSIDYNENNSKEKFNNEINNNYDDNDEDFNIYENQEIIFIKENLQKISNKNLINIYAKIYKTNMDIFRIIVEYL